MPRSGAEKIVDDCLAVSAEDSVCVLNDGYEMHLTEVLVDVASRRAEEVSLVEYDRLPSHGAEPPEEVRRAMREHDVFVAPTAKSLTHTAARKEACDAGSRGATLPGITPEIWNEALCADYGRVERICENVHRTLSDAAEVRISTKAGTDLTIKYDISQFQRDTGVYTTPGSFGNLPAGEVDGAVLDARGTLRVDHCQQAPEGLRIDVGGCEAKSWEAEGDGSIRSELGEAFETTDRATRVAELGIGTNPQATLVGNILQDEKVLGTAHVAFGDNASYVNSDAPNYNPCSIHYDVIFEEPTVTVGDETLVVEGEPQFDTAE